MRGGRFLRHLGCLLVALPVSTLILAAEEIVVGEFSAAKAGEGLPARWRVAKLPGVAATRFEMVELDGRIVVQMDANNAAATLYRPLQIDPEATPILRWRWRVQDLIRGADLYRKQGDDMPARLYVMFDYPLAKIPLIERAKILLARTVAGELVPAAALCYGWDGTLAAGTAFWNAYSTRVRVLVVESGTQRLGDWVTEERDVAADFRSAFGEDPPPISGVAIAADTDQTAENVRAWFGDISFAAR